MIANFFNKTKPINTLIVFVLISIIFAISSFSLNGADFSMGLVFNKLVLLGFLLFTFFVVNFITRKNGLTKANSYVLLLLVFCIGMFPFSIANLKLLITHFILLLAYRRIYSLRTKKNTKEKIFDSSLWIGVAALIYPISAMYMLLTYFAIYIFDKVTTRNVLIPLIGFLLPIFIYSVYGLTTDSFDIFTTSVKYGFSFTSYNALKLLIPITLILGFLIWTIIPTTLKIISVNNEFRTSWFLLLFHLFISILFILPAPVKDGSEFLFLFFPVIIIFTNYLQRVEEKWFKEVFLYLFLSISIAVYLMA